MIVRYYEEHFRHEYGASDRNIDKEKKRQWQLMLSQLSSKEVNILRQSERYGILDSWETSSNG